jgi:hypothetical protein
MIQETPGALEDTRGDKEEHQRDRRAQRADTTRTGGHSGGVGRDTKRTGGNKRGDRSRPYHMAGLGTDDQKSAAHATPPLATPFKIFISHRKNGLLNRLPAKVSFSIFD